MKITLTYCFIFIVSFCFCQELRDSISISEIDIIETKILQSQTGSHSLLWTKEQLIRTNSNNIADLLQLESGIYIKSYGNGSLATSSLRGANAGHTLILWNGIPLNSPMLGLLDLSLLPTAFSESIQVDLGGNSSMQGSSAIGGIISLDNKANFDNKFSIESNNLIGSFGKIYTTNQFSIGTSKVQSKTKYSYSTAKNDFDYFIAEGIPRRIQENAAVSQYNLQQDFHWKIKNNILFSSHYWHQNSNRQIPPHILQNENHAFQFDESNRFLVSVKKLGTKDVLSLKTSFIQEKLDYIDTVQHIESLSNFTSATLSVKYKSYISNHHNISIAAIQNFNTAEIKEYTNIPQEWESAVFGSYKYINKSFQWETSFRQSLINGKMIPFIVNSGADLTVFPYFSIKAKLSKNYNLPSFNDRYWSQGGNPNLLPEFGWSEELTGVFKFKKFGLQFISSLYNRNIKNWILWSPDPQTGFFKATNIAEVWSRGLEQSIIHKQDYSKWSYQSKLSHNFTRSSNQIDIPEINIKAGDQLIYVPRHKLLGSIKFSIDNFNIHYNHQYTSSVAGINDNVPSFHVGNLQSSYTFKINRINTRIFFDIYNIWNTDYIIIERRPMPGRNFQLGLQLNFTNKIK